MRAGYVARIQGPACIEKRAVGMPEGKPGVRRGSEYEPVAEGGRHLAAVSFKFNKPVDLFLSFPVQTLKRIFTRSRDRATTREKNTLFS